MAGPPTLPRVRPRALHEHHTTLFFLTSGLVAAVHTVQVSTGRPDDRAPSHQQGQVPSGRVPEGIQKLNVGTQECDSPGPWTCVLT